MGNAERIESIKEQLGSVPMLPGCYLWKNADGKVIYVGKAKQLRSRMKQYVLGQDERAKIPLMLEQIDSFEYIVVENEYESLVLEKNLIKQYSPFFNADFKDGKTYPFIAITKGDVFPAIKYTREKHVATTRYFGPYTDSRAAREMVDITRKLVPICSAGCESWKRLRRKLESDDLSAFLSQEGSKPCFDCHVGLGPGACCGRMTPTEYRENVARVERFLSGNHREFIDMLQQEMMEAAADLDFERASRIKSRIGTINSLSDRQHAVSSRDMNADVIGIHRDEQIAGVYVFQIREGRIINGNEFVLDKGLDVPDEDLLHNFIIRYYDETTSIPREVIVEEVPDDADEISQWLSLKLASKHGAKVHIFAPQKGEKADLLKMACKNAEHTLSRYKVRTSYDDKRTNEALLQLESALALDGPPMRIECFDISTIHGKHTVASMVVFTNGVPDTSQYRRFKIRTPLTEANDFLSMQEVLGRRYAPERMADERFGSKPDLLILDGGKPQLTAAMEKLAELGVTDIPIAGLAKRDEELFVPWQDSGPVVLPGGSSSLYLVKHVRDESHRFAITFHRELRDKAMTKSILDEVVGLGPVRKKALLKAAGGFRNLRSCTLDQIKAYSVVPHDVAEEVFAVLSQYNSSSDQDIGPAYGEELDDE